MSWKQTWSPHSWKQWHKTETAEGKAAALSGHRLCRQWAVDTNVIPAPLICPLLEAGFAMGPDFLSLTYDWNWCQMLRDLSVPSLYWIIRLWKVKGHSSMFKGKYPTGNSRPFGNLLTLKWDKLMLHKLVIHTSLRSASCKLVELSCPRSCGWREGWNWGCCC